MSVPARFSVSAAIALASAASYARAEGGSAPRSTDAPERRESDIVGYSPEFGAYIRSPDGAWELNPYAMVQITNVTTFKGGDVDQSAFNLHSAKVIFHGHLFSPKLTGHVQVNFGEGRAVAENVYLRDEPLPQVGLVVGQNEVPFNRQHITLEAYQELIERSTVDQRFTLQRDIGVAGYLNDEQHHYEAIAGVFNGSRQNVPNDDRTYMTTLRLAYNPWGPIPFREADLAYELHPKLSVAAAGAYNPRRIVPSEKAGAPPNTLEHITQGVFETTLRYRGLSVTTEAEVRMQRVSGSLRRDAGAFWQVGYFVYHPHLQLAGRIGYMAGDVATGDVAGEQTVGVNWYFNGHRFKVQLDGSRLEYRAAPESWRARAQLEFFL